MYGHPPHIPVPTFGVPQPPPPQHSTSFPALQESYANLAVDECQENVMPPGQPIEDSVPGQDNGVYSHTAAST